MSMDYEYVWRLDPPGDRLEVYMENHRQGEKAFEAHLGLRRTEMSRGALTRVLVRYPWMTLHVIAGIHTQALRLWRKRVPFHSHPSKLPEGASR
jgi:DUF1365 family protein